MAQTSAPAPLAQEQTAGPFAGILKVKVARIDGFKDQASYLDKTDPKVKMWLGNSANPKSGEKMKTTTKDNAGGSVTFDEVLNFNKAENMNLLTVAVYDDNSLGDESFGELSIDLNFQDLTGSIETKEPICFQVAKDGKTTGKVYLSLASAKKAGAEKAAADPKVVILHI
jgi:hypothetical protein